MYKALANIVSFLHVFQSEPDDDDDDKTYCPSNHSDNENNETVLGLPTHSEAVDDDQSKNHEAADNNQHLPSDSNTKSHNDQSPCSAPKPVPRSRKVCQRLLDETDKLRASDMPGVYIKAYRTSTIGKKKEQKNSKRPFDTAHCCKFCGEIRTHMQDHLLSRHSQEQEVKILIALKDQINSNIPETKKELTAELKKRQSSVRFQGDHLHNVAVVKQKKGEVFLGRRSNKDKFIVGNYGPCPSCFEWINLTANTSSHVKSCIGENKGSISHGKGKLVLASSYLLGKVASKASHRVREMVFPTMRNDEIANVAKNDDLIVCLGDVWLAKSMENELRCRNYSSFRMRLAARLLMLLRASLKIPDLKMIDAVVPKHFNHFCEAAIEACQPSGDINLDLEHPSVALKIGDDLSRIAALKLGFAIEIDDEKMRKESNDFLELLKLQWYIKVKKQARVVLNRHNYEKEKFLPHQADIQNLAEHLIGEIKEYNYSDKSPENYRKLQKVVLVRLVTFNKRRSGEMESLL